MTIARFVSLTSTLWLTLGGVASAAETLPLSPIPGVLAAGARAEIIKEGFDGTEGPVPMVDGSVLFTENRADRIIRIGVDGSTSVFMAGANASNALALNPDGELVSVQTQQPRVGVIYPEARARTLASDYQGKAFGRPNDLVISRQGNLYFTDPGGGAPPADGKTTTAVYLLPAKPAGAALVRIADDIERPNGIALDPAERTLYVANTQGEWLFAFALKKDGSVGARRQFAKLAGVEKNEAGVPASGADGVAVDAKGRVYVATRIGVQVFDAKGKALGVIELPKAPQNLAFGGPARDQLFVVGRGSVYRIATQTTGPRGRGK